MKSGLQAAGAHGIVVGRKDGQRPSDKKSERVMSMHEEGLASAALNRAKTLAAKIGTRPHQSRGIGVGTLPPTHMLVPAIGGRWL